MKGFLNLSLSDAFYLKQFQTLFQQEDYGHQPQTQDSPTLMVEFSSPNTNKPLHLGHIRNNILGYSVSKILEANGNRVVKTQIINDRGIHICKSMLAWKKFGAGETPELTGCKGDQLVGKYYVIFDARIQKRNCGAHFQRIFRRSSQTRSPTFIGSTRMLLRLGKQAIKRFETCGKL